MAPAVFHQAKDRLDRELTSPVFTARQLYKMTVPFILDSLSIMFINMLTTALISSSGETSVAAVNLVSPILSLVLCLLNGISAGGTVAVTRCFGAHDTARTKMAAGHVLWLIFAAGTAVCMLFILFPRAALTLLYRQADHAVMEKAVQYVVPGSISIIVFTVYTGVFCILRGLGESKKCLWLTIIINVAYLLFSLLFINVLHMDVRGSAAALLLARILGTAAALAYLFLPKDLPVRFTLGDIFCFRRDILSSILEVALPLALEQLLLYGGNIVITILLVPLGTSAVAVNSVAVSLFGLTTAAANAAGSLAVTVVGRCVGARETRYAFSYGYKMVLLALALLAAGCALLYPLFPTLLEHLYHMPLPSRTEALRLLRGILLPALLFWPMSTIIPNALRAAHDNLFPSALSTATMWIVRVGLGYWLAFGLHMGLWGLWISMWAEWAVRALFLGLRYFRGRWLAKAAGV